MGELRTAVESAFRDYVVAGVPSSGAHEPVKSEIRAALGSLLETVISSDGLGILRFKTVALLNADTTQDDGTLAYVWRNGGTATDPANGVYQWNDPGNAWEPAPWYFSAVSDAIVEIEALAARSAAAADAQRASLIAAGVAQAAEYAEPDSTGFLMVNVSNPTARRTITRALGKVTVEAIYTNLSCGFTFDGRDVVGGREFSADIKVTATAAAAGQAVGLGPVAAARADTARADETDTTLFEIEDIATNDAKLFGLRRAGGIFAYAQEGPSEFSGANPAPIAYSSYASGGDGAATWAVGDVVRTVVFVPNDDTTQRRVTWYKQVGGAGQFRYLAYALIDPAQWPRTSDVWAGIYTTDTFIAEWDDMTAVVPVAGSEAVRYMDGAAPALGLGSRDGPVASLREMLLSVNEASDRLTGVIANNGGAPYRIYTSSGVVFPHARFRELTLLGEVGNAPELRASMPVGAWSLVSGHVWRTANYWNGIASAADGAVICYDLAGLGLSTPGANVGALADAGPNASTATLQALTSPSYSLNTGDGYMYITLPGNQDPNDLDLELAQAIMPLLFGGPAAGARYYKPRVTLENLVVAGGVASAAEFRLWNVLLRDVHFRGAGANVLRFRECSGETHNVWAVGSGNDCVKSDPYQRALPDSGSTPEYADALRPVLRHFDMQAHRAGWNGLGDTVSIHQDGGKMVFYGGRFWDAEKNCMAQVDSFETYDVDCRRGKGGGIAAIFDANSSGEFTVRGGYIGDCGVTGIQIDRQAGTGTTTGTIDGVAIARPNIATPRGIYVTNAAAQAQMVLDIIAPRIDSTIATPFANFADATIRRQAYTAPLPNAANDAAAATAGVQVGGLYRNGGAVQVRLV